MKRFWLGVVLLAALLALGIFESAGIKSLTEPISDKLSQAAGAALEENWTEAQRFSESAKGAWEANWSVLAAMNHHGPMEEIDSQFARAKILLESRSTAEFSACCARIAEMIRALGDAHTVNLRNLL